MASDLVILTFNRFSLSSAWAVEAMFRLRCLKSTLLTNENKRIDNPRVKIIKCDGAEAQDEKSVE